MPSLLAGIPDPLVFPNRCLPPTSYLLHQKRGKGWEETHIGKALKAGCLPSSSSSTYWKRLVLGRREDGRMTTADDHTTRGKRKGRFFFGGRETTNLGRTYRTRRWDGGGDTASSSFSKPGPHLMRGNSPLFQPELYSTKVALLTALSREGRGDQPFSFSRSSSSSSSSSSRLSLSSWSHPTPFLPFPDRKPILSLLLLLFLSCRRIFYACKGTSSSFLYYRRHTWAKG